MEVENVLKVTFFLICLFLFRILISLIKLKHLLFFHLNVTFTLIFFYYYIIYSSSKTFESALTILTGKNGKKDFFWNPYTNLRKKTLEKKSHQKKFFNSSWVINRSLLTFAIWTPVWKLFFCFTCSYVSWNCFYFHENYIVQRMRIFV